MDYAGKDGGGFILTVLLGIVGAVVGGYISVFFGFGGSMALTSAVLWWRLSARLSCCGCTARFETSAIPVAPVLGQRTFYCFNMKKTSRAVALRPREVSAQKWEGIALETALSLNRYQEKTPAIFCH